ncbi:MAG TPA: hypothetical protein VD927_04045 [Chryseosolibacter sp.]|nr:hypothetical protein [Chryseosolibacter sp.]
MKTILICLIAFLVEACSTNVMVKKAPPGQMKKATGSQSAKPYAPGQQKKAAKPAKAATPAQKKKR